MLLRALPDILERCPNLRVTLAGSDARPAELMALQRSYPGVRWAGWLGHDAAREELARCDVFVMPSVSEGMPVALLEAMAYARAIVATPVGGIPDVVTDDAEAILVTQNDPATLTTGVLRAVGDRELRTRLGGAAQARVEEEFNRDRIFSRIAALYDELLAKDAARRSAAGTPRRGSGLGSRGFRGLGLEQGAEAQVRRQVPHPRLGRLGGGVYGLEQRAGVVGAALPRVVARLAAAVEERPVARLHREQLARRALGGRRASPPCRARAARAARAGARPRPGRRPRASPRSAGPCPRPSSSAAAAAARPGGARAPRRG